jgi:hypothetical protein
MKGSKKEKFLGGSGGSLANGLNFKESAKASDESLGMARASKKKNQVPKSPHVGVSPRK